VVSSEIRNKNIRGNMKKRESQRPSSRGALLCVVMNLILRGIGLQHGLKRMESVPSKAKKINRKLHHNGVKAVPEKVDVMNSRPSPKETRTKSM